MLKVFVKRELNEAWQTLVECDAEDELTYRLILLHCLEKAYEYVEVQVPGRERFSPAVFVHTRELVYH